MAEQHETHERHDKHERPEPRTDEAGQERAEAWEDVLEEREDGERRRSIGNIMEI